jgi:hypothetical protein
LWGERWVQDSGRIQHELAIWPRQISNTLGSSVFTKSGSQAQESSATRTVFTTCTKPVANATVTMG